MSQPKLPDLAGLFDDLDLDAWADAHPELHEERSEVAEVSVRIASQFVDVLVMAAGQLLAGRDERRVLDQLEEAVDSLERLAKASAEKEHTDLLAELRGALDEYSRKKDRRSRSRLLDTLREWLPRYGSYLGGDAQERLRGMVEFDQDSVPLFAELQGLRGIGPRRLRRLYAAGFYDPKRLLEASAQDLAAVTGLPQKLAADVLARTVEWQQTRRKRAIIDMHSRLAEFQRVMQTLAPEERGELSGAAEQALADMRKLVEELGAQG